MCLTIMPCSWSQAPGTIEPLWMLAAARVFAQTSACEREVSSARLEITCGNLSCAANLCLTSLSFWCEIGDYLWNPKMVAKRWFMKSDFLEPVFVS